MASLKDYDVVGIDARLAKLGHQRGPGPGMGRSAGRPWNGIVEDTPALWVGWIVEGYKRLGRPLPERLWVGITPVALAWVQLTFGRRYYFLCPHCGRRCETLYFLGGRFACRKCLRLGYRSQTRRPGSAYAWLDWVFGREKDIFRRWHPAERDVTDETVLHELRHMIGERIEAMLAQVSIGREGGAGAIERSGEVGPAGGPPAGRAGAGGESGQAAGGA